MGEWLKRRIESIGDNLIFTGIVAGVVAVWTTIKSLPILEIVIISLVTYVVVLLIIRVVWSFLLKPKEGLKNLRKIPEILNQMHKRLTILTEKQIKECPIQPEIIGDDLSELYGFNESEYPELKQITPTSDTKNNRQILETIFTKIVQKLKNNKE